MPVPRQFRPSVQAYYCLQFNASTDFWYRRSTIFSTAPVPTKNSQPSDISDEYQYPAAFHPVLCQYNDSNGLRLAVLARYQASCEFVPGKEIKCAILNEGRETNVNEIKNYPLIFKLKLSLHKPQATFSQLFRRGKKRTQKSNFLFGKKMKIHFGDKLVLIFIKNQIFL